MNTEATLSNAVLWAAAIIAAALLDAPAPLTLMVLPGLAAASLVHAAARRRSRPCRARATHA